MDGTSSLRDALVGTITTTTNACNIGYPYYPYYSYSVPYCSGHSHTPSKLGDFDIHLDSAGNLRIIRDGKLLQTFFKKEEKSE